jgi:lipopolysaccharide/colanic/teichoic acid biosynthesis glycosyltransferase
MPIKSIVAIHPFYFSPAKRILDVGVSLGLLICLAPLLIVVGLTVLASAGRPILFKQQRWGYKNRLFWLYKFRTMKLDSHQQQAKLADKNEAPFPMFKLHQDPRFVGIGRWLSNTGLDELPQLINILRGEMSLIGPRPLPVAEAKILHRLYPSWRFRELVKPGIFSLWSLDAKRHSSLKHWQELDQKTLVTGGLSYELGLILANTLRATSWTTRTSIYRIKLWLIGKINFKSN